MPGNVPAIQGPSFSFPQHAHRGNAMAQRRGNCKQRLRNYTSLHQIGTSERYYTLSYKSITCGTQIGACERYLVLIHSSHTGTSYYTYIGLRRRVQVEIYIVQCCGDVRTPLDLKGDRWWWWRGRRRRRRLVTREKTGPPL